MRQQLYSIFLEFTEKITEKYPKNPGFLGFLAHAQTVCTRLYFSPPRKKKLSPGDEARFVLASYPSTHVQPSVLISVAIGHSVSLINENVCYNIIW